MITRMEELNKLSAGDDKLERIYDTICESWYLSDEDDNAKALKKFKADLASVEKKIKGVEHKSSNEEFQPGPEFMKAFEKQKATSGIKSQSLIKELDKKSIADQHRVYANASGLEGNRKKLKQPMLGDLDKIQSPSYNGGYDQANKTLIAIHRTLHMGVDYNP